MTTTPAITSEPIAVATKDPHSREDSRPDVTDQRGEDTVAAAFKAIGHPVRLRILSLLARGKEPLCVCHIEERFTLAQPTISHHLRVLRKAGLVSANRKGTWVYYAAREPGIAPLRAFLEQLQSGPSRALHGVRQSTFLTR